jgi:predicted PurR-regulated permease PerM
VIPSSGSEALAALEQHAKELAPGAMDAARGAAAGLLGGTASVLGGLAAALIVPVLAFYLLRDFDLMVAAATELIPHERRESIVGLGREIDEVLGQFVRGQLTVMAILAALYAVGYALVGVPLAVPIGIVAGLLSFIPYVGGGLSLGLASLMVALHWNGIGQLLGVLAVYGMVQLLEGLLITPKIVGDKLGLPAVFVLIALMVGAELFGFLGIMAALPAAAVIKVLSAHAVRRYRESALFTGAPACSSERAPSRLKHRRVQPLASRRRDRSTA